jgi:hypothetical protein
MCAACIWPNTQRCGVRWREFPSTHLLVPTTMWQRPCFLTMAAASPTCACMHACMHAPPFVRWHAVACSSFSAKCATTRSAIIADQDGQPLALRLCVHPCCRTTRAGMLLAAVTDCARRPTARCSQLLSAACALRLCLSVCFITCAGMPIRRSRCPPLHARAAQLLSALCPAPVCACMHACTCAGMQSATQ